MLAMPKSGVSSLRPRLRWPSSRLRQSARRPVDDGGAGREVECLDAHDPPAQAGGDHQAGASARQARGAVAAGGVGVTVSDAELVKYGVQPDGSLVLHDGMFHEDGCIRTPYLDAVPGSHQCATHQPPQAVEPRQARPTIRGYYAATQRGDIARDGSSLDQVRVEYVVASAWLSPSCKYRQCWRPEVLGMVPPELRRCAVHGIQKPPSPDPYELDRDSEDWRHAEEYAWRKLRAKAGVPARYHNASMRTGEATPALHAARRLVDTEDYLGRCVVLYGGVGCGKTHAAYAFYRYLLIEEARVGISSRDSSVFYTFPDLVTLLLDPETRAETIERCRAADEIIVDDWGSTYVKSDGMVHGLLEELVIHREANDYPMVITTNLAPRAFLKRFGPRIYDRIRGSWGAWLDVRGPSLRGKAKR
jgi:DNA replication protein DnaC